MVKNGKIGQNGHKQSKAVNMFFKKNGQYGQNN